MRTKYWVIGVGVVVAAVLIFGMCRSCNRIEVVTPQEADDMAIGDDGVSVGLQPFSIPTKNNPTKGSPASMITFGKRYLGAPYVYGAKRGQDNNFDCSSFTQYVFKQARGMDIGSDSRKQKEYVQKYGSNRYVDWKKRIKIGDLIFMTSYRGTSKSVYKDVNKNSPITHVAIYAGKDSKGRHLILHTASAPKGVHITHIDGTHWEYRIVYNGRPY